MKNKEAFFTLQEQVWKEIQKGRSQYIFYHTFNSTPMEVSPKIGRLKKIEGDHENRQDPFFPFLYWIKEETKDFSYNDLAKFLEKSGVFPDHQETFASFLFQEESLRKEPILFRDRSYQRQMLYKSLWSLFIEVFDNKPLAFQITQGDYLPYSTLLFLEYLLNLESTAPFLFLFSMGFNTSFTDERRKRQEERVFSLTKTNAYMINSRDASVFTPETIDDQPIDVKLKQAQINQSFLCWEDALSLYKDLKKRVTTQSFKNQEFYESSIYQGLGYCYLFMDELNKAQSSFLYVKKIYWERKKTQPLAEIYYYLGVTYKERREWVQAKRMAKLSLYFAEAADDLQSLFHADFLLLEIESLWHFLSQEEWETYFNSTMNMAEQLGFSNARLFLLTTPFQQQTELQNKFGDLINQGIKLAQERRNEFRLALAYVNKARFFSQKESAKKVNKYYLMAMEIQNRLDNHLELAFYYNNYGYFNLIHGHYLVAHEYFTKALELLKINTNFNEIGNSIFLEGLNLLLSGNSKEAIYIFSYADTMLRNLKISKLGIHPHSDVLSLLGIAYLKTGEQASAWRCYLEIQNKPLHDKSEQNENYYKTIFLGLIEKNNENYELSEELFTKALDLTEKNAMTFMIPFLFSELSLLYMKWKNKTKTVTVLQRGFLMAKKMRNKYYTELFDYRLKNKIHRSSAFEPNQSPFNIEWIQTKLDYEKTVTKLHKKKEELSFINLLQESLSHRTNKKTLLRRVLEQIFTSHPFVAVLYHEKHGEEFRLIQENSSFSFEHRGIKDLVKWLCMNPSCRKVQLDPEQHPYLTEMGVENTIVSLPVWKRNNLHGHILGIYGDINSTAQSKDITSLNISAMQIGLALEALELDMELRDVHREMEKVSRTDYLTGLGNYYALTEDLERELNRQSRKKKDTPDSISIINIDVDKFSVFNETYGHQAGDEILKAIGQSIKHLVRKMDKVYRLHEDEFIILSPQTDLENASKLALRIQLLLKNEFEIGKILSNYFNQDFFIPDSMNLTCSMGICTSTEKTMNPNMTDVLIKLANENLKKAKKAGGDTIVD